MSKGAWAGADGKAVVFCLECDWKSDRFNAEHDCPRKPENLEKVIARYRALLKRIEWAGDESVFTCPECRSCSMVSMPTRHEPDCELAALLS